MYIFYFLPFKFQPSKFPLVTEDPNNDFESLTLLLTLILALSPLPKDHDIDNCISFILDQFDLEEKSPTPSILHLLLFPCCTLGLFYSTHSPMEQCSSLLGI